ncbi:MAG: hypothetical protein SGI88_09585 [Candidatus Hydrogenedentes bacterium]|nr:hypothetical protein [Candidatus Hydrogenedentota bacterium]
MRTFAAFCIVCIMVANAMAQVGLEGQPAQNAELTRALDAASAAFAAAQRDAAAGHSESFKRSLNVANVRWAECYGQYRQWPTSDTAWRPNFDSINTNLLNAVNAITPGDSLPAAKAQIDAAAATLTALKTRNGVIDIRASTTGLQTALEGLNTTITGFQGRPLTTADVEALRVSYGAARDGWVLFSQAMIDYNALGYEPGRLQRFREMIALQTIGIDSIENILNNSDTPTLLTQWQSVRAQILALLTEINGDVAASGVPAAMPTPGTPTDAAKTVPDRGGTGDGRESAERPRLLPRLRR